MNERPIIFSGDMVRAFLEGRKTQTRRLLMKARDEAGTWAGAVLPAAESGWIAWWPGTETGLAEFTKRVYRTGFPCPYGAPGDRLWVRETWRVGAWRDDGRMAIDYAASPELTHTPWVTIPDDDGGAKFNMYWAAISDELQAHGVETDADGQYHWEPGQAPLRWRPSIHMPRWASRITLEITEVRVQRLQEVTEENARAEGAFDDGCLIPEGAARMYGHSGDFGWSDPRKAYAFAWDAIYAKRGLGWDANPWVWAITFRRVEEAA